MKLATPIPMQRLCELGQVSRAGFYRWRHAQPARDADLDLRDEIQRIATELALLWLAARAGGVEAPGLGSEP